MPTTDTDLALSSVSEALDALLTALVALNGLPDVEVPGEALDLALRSDKSHREARKGLVEVLVHVQVVLGAENFKLFLNAEERINALVAAATDVGFKLGLSIASKSKE